MLGRGACGGRAQFVVGAAPEERGTPGAVQRVGRAQFVGGAAPEERGAGAVQRVGRAQVVSGAADCPLGGLSC